MTHDGRYVYGAWRAAVRGEPFPATDHLATGLGGVEGHPQPGIYKIREGGGYLDGKRQASQLVPVKIYLVDATGAVVHHWRPGLTLKAEQGRDRRPVDPHKVWLWCQTKTANGNVLAACSQEDYHAYMDEGRWPDDAPAHSQPEPEIDEIAVSADGAAPAGVGHNSAGDPDGYDSLVALLAQEEVAADAWIAQGKEGAQAATLAKNWKDKLLELERRIKAAFEAEKKPFWEECVRIDAKWRGAKAGALALKDKMERTFNAIARKEQARLQAIANAEAEKRAAELRAKHEAAIAAQRAAQAATPSPEPLPPPPPPPVVVAEQVRVTFGTGRKAAPKPPRKVYVVNDWPAVAHHYCMATAVQEALQKMVNADGKRGLICPGVTVMDEEAAA